MTVRAALTQAIELYQGWSSVRPGRCRFVPSCSAYAHEAITVHGAARGSWLAAGRILRCRPGQPHGHDPVPDLGGPVAPSAPSDDQGLLMRR